MNRKLLLSYQGDNYTVTITRRIGAHVPSELFDQIALMLRQLENQITITLPAPPNKTCFVCHARLDVPTAYFVGPHDGWDLQWNCPSQCDEHELLIEWPWPRDMLVSIVDVRRAGFTVIN